MTTFFEKPATATLKLPQQGLRTALTIAGLDPSGGAGITADIRTFEALGVYGMAVASALTYQSTKGLEGRYDVPAAVVLRQLEELFGDRAPNAIKTGALGGAEAVREVGLLLMREFKGPVVVDPVTRAGSGGELLDGRGVELLSTYLVPIAAIITPNAEEAGALSGFAVGDVKDAEAAALRIVEMGPRAVLVTGVKLVEGDEALAADVYCDGAEIEVFTSKWIDGLSVHGTGCVLSAAIAACLALGMTLKDAVLRAREITRVSAERALSPGRGAACANPSGLTPGPEQSSPRNDLTAEEGR
jgi:hydroxymethylpyrimidine kinase/phosphomethylpyrimidine kinase